MEKTKNILSGNGIRNQIDYILINERFRNDLLDIKTMMGTDSGSDHFQLCGEAQNSRVRRSTKLPCRDVQLNSLFGEVQLNSLCGEVNQTPRVGRSTILPLWGGTPGIHV